MTDEILAIILPISPFVAAGFENVDARPPDQQDKMDAAPPGYIETVAGLGYGLALLISFN